MVTFGFECEHETSQVNQKDLLMRTLSLDEMQAVSGGCVTRCHNDNGWGNGDDDAPGHSLMHNRAENNVIPGAAHVTWGTPASPYSDVCGCNPTEP
jgi:hypothetical protein